MKDDKTVVDALTGAKSLPMEEKLKLLDQEIRKLQKACTEEGYGPDKIRKVADPVMKTIRRAYFKKTAKLCLFLFIGSIAFAGLCYGAYQTRAVRVATKKFMVYWVLPYYDWTWPFMSDCLLNNPFYDPPIEEFSEENCQNCEKLTGLLPEYDVDPDMVAEKIYAYKPMIIGDAMGEWRSRAENVNLNTFIKLYATDERTMNISGVKKTNFFRTTRDIPPEIRNATALAKWLYSEEENGNKHDFTAQWCNSHTDSYKALHYYYTKPYFLPSMCESIRNFNYFMAARRQAEDKGKGLILRPRMNDMGIWIAQVYGRYEFILQPEKVCEKTCEKIRFVLEQGEMLNVPIGLFSITYRPNSTEAVAFGVGYEFQ